MTEALPEHYRWLSSEPGPRMLREALPLYGTKERPGPFDNPVILKWAAETGLADLYRSDTTAWCGLFMAVVAKRAGKPLPKRPLWARDWAGWGVRFEEPMLGDVLVFKRPGGGGHVGLYVGEDDASAGRLRCFHVLGGNQGNAVSIKRILIERLISARRFYAAGTPSNVRRIVLTPRGSISTNEE